jgi:outer membrane protein assembly factor BamB
MPGSLTTKSLLVAMTFVLPLLMGCESLKNNNRREFVLENSWARQTTKDEFMGFRRMNRMSPVLLDKMIIQANSIDGLVAYDRKSGSQLWRIDLKNGVEGGAQAVGDKLYFGSSNGQFYCVSLKDGKTLWTIPVRAETLAQPTVEAGVVYFESGADVIYAVDAETGKQLWLYNRQVTGSLSIRATTRPVIAGDTLLAGFSDGFLVALRKRDGGLLWERKLGRGTRFKDVDASPVVDGTTVYASSFDAALYSLNLESGEVNWTLDEGAYVPVTLGTEHLADRLFYATANGKIVAVDKHTGKALMTIPLKHGIATQVSLYKNLLVYGESEGSLVIADAQSGAQVAHFDSGQGLVSRPIINESTGETYFISNNANLFALRMGYRKTSDRLPWRVSL